MKTKLYVVRVKKAKGQAKRGTFLSRFYGFTYRLAKAYVYTKEDARMLLRHEKEFGPYGECFEMVEVELKLVK